MWRFIRSNQIANVTSSSSVSVRNWTAAAVAIIATSHNNASTSRCLNHDCCNQTLTMQIFVAYALLTKQLTGTGTGAPEYSSKAFSTVTNEKGSDSSILSAEAYRIRINGIAKNWINAKVTFCESSAEDDSNGNQKDEPETNKSDRTFRQRRLSINNTNIMNRREKKNEEQAQKEAQEPIKSIHHSSSRGDSVRIMYASEFENEESTFVQEILPTNKHHEQQDASFCTSTLPFQSHQVGTFSCHGIEPHPFIIYDPPEPDTEITSFFRKMFGAEPAKLSLRSRAKVITMSKQKINQDRGHICMYPSGDSGPPSVLFGAYDGHGEKGELLAEYTMNTLYDKLQHHPSYHGIDEEQDMARAFHEIINEIDDEVKDHHHLSPLNSGSTACVALLQGRKLWVANVGDSRAVLGRRRVKGAKQPGYAAGAKSPNKKDDFPSKVSDDSLNLDAIDLSRDHNVHDRLERERILNSGGYITVPQDPELPARIWLDEKCSQIGLAMSRSIGDHALKHVGVIAEPVVTDYELGDNDEVSKKG